MNCIPFIEVLTHKKDNILGVFKYKVRLAARGDLQVDKPEDTYSPTSLPEHIRLFIVILKANGLLVVQGDAPSAYLNGKLPEAVYLLLPNGHSKKDRDNTFVYKCPSSLYGLAIAGRVWYYTFVKVRLWF